MARRFIVVMDILDDEYPGDREDVTMMLDEVIGDVPLMPDVDLTVYEAVEDLVADYAEGEGAFEGDGPQTDGLGPDAPEGLH